MAASIVRDGWHRHRRSPRVGPRGVFRGARVLRANRRRPFSNTTSYFYAVPFAGVAVLILLLEHTPTALLASALFAIALGVMTGNLQLAVFCLLSCLAAILGLFQYKRRTALFALGLLVGSVNFVTVLAIDLLAGRYFPPSTFSFDLLCAISRWCKRFDRRFVFCSLRWRLFFTAPPISACLSS